MIGLCLFRFDPREIEQRVDELEQAQPVAMHGLQEVAVRRHQPLLARQQLLDRKQHERQRRT